MTTSGQHDVLGLKDHQGKVDLDYPSIFPIMNNDRVADLIIHRIETRVMAITSISIQQLKVNSKPNDEHLHVPLPTKIIHTLLMHYKNKAICIGETHVFKNLVKK